MYDMKKCSIAIFSVAATAILAAHASSIRLKATIIDPPAKTARLLTASATPVAIPARGVYLVQPPDGEVTDEWRDQLVALGAKIRSYIPDDTYLVEIPGDRYADLAANLPHAYLGEFKPEYRYDAAELPATPAARLLSTPAGGAGEAADAARFDILLFERGTAEAVAQKIAALDGCSVEEASGRSIRAVLTAAAVKEVASWPDVHWIERFQESVPTLDMALKAERANVESVWEGGATLLGLTGTNQIIGVADTGLDTGTNSTLHLDIRNRLVYRESVSGRGQWHDQNGHGTHVVGCAMGNGRRSDGGIRGPAYEAHLVMQSTLANNLPGSDDISLPSDLEGMFLSAYDQGARVHNNSYGWGDKGNPYSYYAGVCQHVDNFVFTHPDMTIVYSVGNNGGDISPTNGVVDTGTLNGYGAAKNSIVVGASENLQTNKYSNYTYGGIYFPVSPIKGDSYSKPYDGKNQGLAAFSGRGPTSDGRVRPDIVAPGTGILAMLSSLSPSPGNSSYDAFYRYNQGTSMAAPIVSGSAALVRQWMDDQYGIASPDAATVKAILLAGAKSISPGQYGTGSFREIPSTYPNNAEGWGQLNLSNSLANVTGVYVENAQVIGNSSSHLYSLEVPAGRPVTFMLAWTDAAGDPSASDTASKRVNALNFTLRRDDGRTYTMNPGGSTGATVLGVRIPASEMTRYHVFTAEVWTASNSIKTGMDTSLTGGKSNATRYSLVVNGGRAYRTYWNAYFHYNNGTGQVKTNHVNVGATLYDFQPKPTRSGYVFEGWYTAASGGRRISPFTIQNRSNRHFYAHWRPEGPANDNFAKATSISGYYGSASGTTRYATKEEGEPLPKFKTAATNTVWWTWTAPASGKVQFNTAGSGIDDTVMGIYRGSSASVLTKVAENDDGISGTYLSSNAFDVVSGTTYRICVAGYGNNNVGSVKVNWSYLTKVTVTLDANGGLPSHTMSCCLGRPIGELPTATRSGYAFDGWWRSGTRLYPTTVITESAAYTARWISRPENDSFANAESISGMTGSVSESTRYATKEEGEPLPKFRTAATNTVWWSWTAPASGNVVFNTTNTTFDTVMGSYTGSSLTALTTVAENDDGGPGMTSICSFAAVKGTTYYIAVSGYGTNSQGVVELGWSLAPDVYLVRYRRYDGSGETAEEDFECGKTYSLAWLGSMLGWMREGYEFCGWVPWNPDTKPRLCKYDNGQPVKDLAAVGETIELYCGWKSSSSYRVCFHRCAGPDDLVKMNQVILRNKEDSLAWMDSMIGWKRDGYTFAGWDESDKATTVKYANGAKVKNLAMNGGTKHLYAVWRAKDDHKYPYTVKFYRYDGSGETRTQSFNAGTVQSLLWFESQLGWKRDGYEFVGWVPWNPDTKARLCKYVNGQKVVDLASKSGEVVNLYAAWKSSSSYRVCFHMNDGTDVKMNQVILRNKEDNLAWMDSQIGWKRDGYVFRGWAETTGTSTVKYANGAKVKNLAMDGGTKHLYAVWRVAD